MRMLTWSSIALSSAVLVCAGILAGCDQSVGSGPPHLRQAEAVRVDVLEVSPVSIKDYLDLPGETEARHDVALAAERDGQVQWIGPKEGDRVSEGELIAKIDVATLKAALDRAKAAYNLAKDVGVRRQALFDGGIVSQEQLDQTLTERLLAESSLQEAQVNYDQGFVRSPIAGLVNHLPVDEGEFVNRGEVIAEIVDIHRIRINVRVPELDVPYFRVGQKTRVSIDALPDHTWTGTVDLVSFKGDPATKTFKVRVVVDNQDLKIRPGMIAHVTFLRRVIDDAILAPLFSLIDRGGERLVFVEKDGKAQARTVQIGVIEGDKAQILDGLAPGDRLIVKGQHDVEEGMRVTTQ